MHVKIKQNFPIIIFITLAVFIWSFLSGSLFAREDKTAGKIAILVPENGPYATYGELQLKGYKLAEVQLAQRDVNVDVRYFDIGAYGSSVEKFLEKQVITWKPNVIIGPYSTKTADEVVKFLENRDIPLIIPSATGDHLTQTYRPYVYRVATPTFILTRTVMNYIGTLNKDAPLRKIVIIAENDDFGESSTESLREHFKNHSSFSVESILYSAKNLQGTLARYANQKNIVVIGISRSTQDCLAMTDILAGHTRMIGLGGGFLTPTFREYVLLKKINIDVLSPWNNDIKDPSVTSFIKKFVNKYKTGDSSFYYPQYHNAQAYSSLLLAGEALEKSHQSEDSLLDTLQNNSFRTPLGVINFADFDGYYQQSNIPPVIQRYKDGAIQTVYPEISGPIPVEETKFEAEENEDVSFLNLLFENQFIALFCIIGLGLLLGNIKIAGLSLGTSGVLFTALLFGHFHFTIPAGIGTLGLIFFIYCVGLSAGPNFFNVFMKEGKRFAKISIIIVSSAAIVTWILSKIFDIPVDLAVGIFAGALTSTPALAAALDALKELGTDVSVGYGIAYPFGVMGVVLFVQLLPRLLKIDLDHLNNQIQAKAEAQSEVKEVLVEVLNPAIIGKYISENEYNILSDIKIVSVVKGDTLVPLYGDTKFEEGQILKIVGEEKNLFSCIDFLGKKIKSEHLKSNGSSDIIEVVVTSKELIDRTIVEIQPLKNYNVTITGINRNDITFVPSENTKIELNDKLKVLGNPESLQEFVKISGHRAMAIYETDLLSLTVGMLTGVVIGLMPISIAGSPDFSLGLSGGLLLVSLILGHYGRIGRIVGRVPYASRSLMMEIGLVFFLASAGIQAGNSFMQILEIHGLKLFLVGGSITLSSMIIGFVISAYILKLNLLQSLGVICGGMTSTPALGAIKSKTDSNIPVISYATAYPVAIIFKLIFVNILIAVLSTS